MVFPACLPITTDFFPDEVNLQTFHVFSNYNLLPEDVNAEVALKRAVYREPLSTTEVFYQMICQRLSQVNIPLVYLDRNLISNLIDKKYFRTQGIK